MQPYQYPHFMWQYPPSQPGPGPGPEPSPAMQMLRQQQTPYNHIMMQSMQMQANSQMPQNTGSSANNAAPYQTPASTARNRPKTATLPSITPWTTNNPYGLLPSNPTSAPIPVPVPVKLAELQPKKSSSLPEATITSLKESTTTTTCSKTQPTMTISKREPSATSIGRTQTHTPQANVAVAVSISVQASNNDQVMTATPTWKPAPEKTTTFHESLQPLTSKATTRVVGEETQNGDKLKNPPAKTASVVVPAIKVAPPKDLTTKVGAVPDATTTISKESTTTATSSKNLPATQESINSTCQTQTQPPNPNASVSSKASSDGPVTQVTHLPLSVTTSVAMEETKNDDTMATTEKASVIVPPLKVTIPKDLTTTVKAVLRDINQTRKDKEARRLQIKTRKDKEARRFPRTSDLEEVTRPKDLTKKVGAVTIPKDLTTVKAVLRNINQTRKGKEAIIETETSTWKAAKLADPPATLQSRPATTISTDNHADVDKFKATPSAKTVKIIIPAGTHSKSQTRTLATPESPGTPNTKLVAIAVQDALSNLSPELEKYASQLTPSDANIIRAWKPRKRRE